MVLLTELTHSPHSDSAAEHRKVIDIIFALLDPKGGVISNKNQRVLSEAGQQTWVYLRRLRERAWHNAGLDAADVWTREQAVQFCSDLPDPEPTTARHEPGMDMSQATVSTPAQMSQISAEYGGMDVMMSPPHIDWDYIDQILGTDQQMNFDFHDDDFNPGG